MARPTPDQYVLFDVGANDGFDSTERTRLHENMLTYAFEPLKEFCAGLAEMTQKYKERYHVYNVAVADYCAEHVAFGVACHGDWGVSSLKKFQAGLSQTWPDRHDLYFDRTDKVAVITLKYFIEDILKDKNLHIDYLHCDTQGSDLEVLRGLGEYIEAVDMGMVEVPQSPELALYVDQHTREETLAFLTDHGFEIAQEYKQQNESNLAFRRKGRRLWAMTKTIA